MLVDFIFKITESFMVFYSSLKKKSSSSLALFSHTVPSSQLQADGKKSTQSKDWASLQRSTTQTHIAPGHNLKFTLSEELGENKAKFATAATTISSLDVT